MSPWRALISRDTSRLFAALHPRALHLPACSPLFPWRPSSEAEFRDAMPATWNATSFSDKIFGSLPNPAPGISSESSLDVMQPPPGNILSTGAVYHARVLEEDLRSFMRNLGKQVEDAPLLLHSETTSIREPGCLGLEDLTMEADSVKRKRKKKMNKHKHRKLRRLARKSKK